MIQRAVVISDCTDIAFAEMRGSIISSARHAGLDRDPVIEALVPVHHFSVLNAGFVLRLMAEAYSTDTLLMVIMNSIQQRTERIAGRLENGMHFEGTNTGAFGWLLRDFAVDECVELHDPGFVPFGGKFVHSPAVGKLLAGSTLVDVGDAFPVESVRRVEPEPNQIVHVDNFGNGKFLLEGAFTEGQALTVELDSGVEIGAVYGRRMMSHPDGTWVVYPGSSMNLHEIGEVRGPGLNRWALAPGEVVRISKT